MGKHIWRKTGQSRWQREVRRGSKAALQAYMIGHLVGLGVHISGTPFSSDFITYNTFNNRLLVQLCLFKSLKSRSWRCFSECVGHVQVSSNKADFWNLKGMIRLSNGSYIDHVVSFCSTGALSDDIKKLLRISKHLERYSLTIQDL